MSMQAKMALLVTLETAGSGQSLDEDHCSLVVSPEDLDLDHTLKPGQSFRWKRDDRGVWTGVVQHRVIQVWRAGEEVRYRISPGGRDDSFIRDYFRLEVDLQGLYRDFIRADGRIAASIERFKGLRVLRQDPEETLFSYICSAANSVPRISASVETLSRCYGKRIALVDGQEYFSFPTAEAIAGTKSAELENVCSLGFRCANLNAVARQMLDRPTGWLGSLRQADFEHARHELLSVRSVGNKIADCVLLMSLDKDLAFPVDTHVRQMAVRHYLPDLRQKTLTDTVYHRIAEYFQSRFGPYAGWAQEYLFYEDLLRGG